MAFHSLLHHLLIFTLLPSFVFSRTWPNPQLDELDAQRYDRTGYKARAFAGEVIPCTLSLLGIDSGRSNAADWLRTAYHDMSTHNIEDGTGGLDASIRFETGRPENAGDGLNLTLKFLPFFSNRYTSIADTLALGAITAVEQCGGPKIDFRGGRVDALEAGPPGVPQPQEDLQTHISTFAKQGFTQEEMVGLVACGHTFGGVQNVAFPDIVPPSDDPENTSGNVHFDSTYVTFDNKVATEYLDGTTQNPLVVGHNSTTNSDGRIFASDGNKTMETFADAAQFTQTCASLLARMLDTVPQTVQLTDVIDPLPVKPDGVLLVHNGNNTMTLQGDLRLWNTQENANRSVKVLWTDREGQQCDGCSGQLTHTTNQVGLFTPGNISSVWYSFSGNVDNLLTIDETKPISKFWFEIEEDGQTSVEDQDGVGYPIQDLVLLLGSSCRVNGPNLRIDIAVRKDVSPSRVYVEFDVFDIDTGVPFIEAYDAQLSGNSTSGEYLIWSVDVIGMPNWSNVAADIGDQKYTSATLQHYVYPDC